MIPVTRTQVRLRPDARRVVIKPFMPGAHIPSNGQARARQVIDRVLGLSTADVAAALASTLTQFAPRHPDFDARGNAVRDNVLFANGLGLASVSTFDDPADRGRCAAATPLAPLGSSSNAPRGRRRVRRGRTTGRPPPPTCPAP